MYRNQELYSGFIVLIFFFPTYKYSVATLCSQKAGNTEVNEPESLSIELTLQCRHRHLKQALYSFSDMYKVLWNLKGSNSQLFLRRAECFHGVKAR